MEKLSKEQESIIFEGFDNSDTNEQFETFLKEKGIIEEAFEVGEWYKHKDGNHEKWLYCVDDAGYGYGFNTSGEWCSKNKEVLEYIKEYGLIKATPEEIQSALTKEAKKRGFKDKAKYRWENCPIRTVLGSDFVYDGGVLRINGFTIMDAKGIWVDIIEEENKWGTSQYNMRKALEMYLSAGCKEDRRIASIVAKEALNGEKYIKQ